MFRHKDLITYSPSQMSASKDMMMNRHQRGSGVLDRLRVSQQMLESREQKLKIAVLSSNLLENDGDHGKGLLKRKSNIPYGVNMILKDNVLSRKSLQSTYDAEQSGPPSLGSRRLLDARLKKDLGGGLLSQTSQILSANKQVKDSNLKDLPLDHIDYPNPATGYKKVILPNLRDRDRSLNSYKIGV